MKTKQGDFEYEYDTVKNYLLTLQKEKIYKNLLPLKARIEMYKKLWKIGNKNNVGGYDVGRSLFLFSKQEHLNTFEEIKEVMGVSSACRLMGIEDVYTEWEERVKRRKSSGIGYQLVSPNQVFKMLKAK